MQPLCCPGKVQFLGKNDKTTKGGGKRKRDGIFPPVAPKTGERRRLKTLFQLQRDFGLSVFVCPINAAVVDRAFQVEVGRNAHKGKARHTEVEDVYLLIVLAPRHCGYNDKAPRH